MRRTTLIPAGFILIALVLLAGIWQVSAYYSELPQQVSQHETIILGQTRLVPGSQAGLRVVVRDSKDAAPLPDAEIQVSMHPKDGAQSVALYSGRTNLDGTAQVAFKVPDAASPDQVLVIETKSKLGSDRVEKPVSLQREARILLTTDKPLYQPGQVIHVRALALSTFDLKPAANQALEVVIADGKGNKVFRQSLTTSDFGVAATDFQLAEAVNPGEYKISATLGETASEKTVSVEQYVLPKFAVKLETARPFYLPGEHVSGTLRADYFFGKPVAAAEVQVEGFSFDVEKTVAFTLKGETGGDGTFDFEFDLPAYIAGFDLEGGGGRFYLQATVTDQARHSEASNLSLPVSQSQLKIEAVPESGEFRSGVENILYILTSYPDGSPADVDLEVLVQSTGETFRAQSGPYGLAEVRFIPNSPFQPVQITARDQQGASAQKAFNFEGQWAEETVILRPEKPVYKVGETMNLTVLTTQPAGTVYLDIVREGQTVSTRTVEVEAGRGEAAVDLTPDLYGTLELHAYKVLHQGTITRDTRLVVVDAATDLTLGIHPDQEVYRPGDSAGVDLQAAGPDGNGVQAAVGLAIVDESVFALADQDPGFARLYFLLEEEILKPRIDLHGFSVPQLMVDQPAGDPALLKAQEGAAQASLAKAVAKKGLFSLQANSHEIAMERAYALQAKFFAGFSKAMYGLGLALILGVFGLSLLALRREGRPWKSLLTGVILVGLPVLALITWPLGPAGAWARTPFDRLSFFLMQLTDQGMFVIGMTLLGLACLIVLVWYAIAHKDGTLGGMLGLMLLVLAAFGFAVYAAVLSQNSQGLEKAALWGLGAYGLMTFAYVLRGASFGLGKRFLPAKACLGLVPVLWAGLLPPLIFAGNMAEHRAPVRAGFAMGGRMLEGAAIQKGMAPPMMAAAPAPTTAPAAQDAASSQSGPEAGPQAAEPPRLRQYFPETMLWLPDAMTDPGGRLHIDVPVADSITTWRISALASSADGRLGSATQSLRVFQDFFIDLDLPLALTVGDEVAVPVGVFNYLKQEQAVRLELEQADWFTLLDEPVKEMTIPAGDIDVLYFRIRARDFGRHSLKVTAIGTEMSDAIQKEVRVSPDGKPFRFTYSDRLVPGTPARQAVTIPAEAIPGTQNLLVKIYPGILSQVVEGLDSMLMMPYGCFEQTSSTTYPNLLVLDYLKTSGQLSPETQLKAEEYINLGYQRLTTFEVGSSGGFSLFGEAPADRMLTAYGLQEFSDMSRVHPVDRDIIQRAAEFLFSSQLGDGSWENDRGLVHESTWANLGNDRLPVTAYIAWSLVDSGFASDPRARKGLEYVREFQGQASDPYVLALAANALVSGDLKDGGRLTDATEAALERLAGLAERSGNGATWPSGVATFMGSQGKTGSLETTALAAYAFLRADRFPELANAALTALIQQKDASGTWYNTQTTVLALKALNQSIRPGSENARATVTVSLNGSQARTIQVSPENFDVVQLLAFDDVRLGADNTVEVLVDGEGSLMYQVSGGYSLPWDKLSAAPEPLQPENLVDIRLGYDRTNLAVNDTVNVNVDVAIKEGNAEQALIDLGIPPGFDVQVEDLAALVNRFNDLPKDYPGATIERYELTGRQVLVYVRNLSAGQPLAFSYRLRAKFPLKAQAPASNVYDYYNPEVSGTSAPLLLTVEE